MKFYAVIKGRKIGIFTSWEETKGYVSGYPGAKYKSFPDINSAKKYLEDDGEVKEMNEKNNSETENTTTMRIYSDGSCINGIGGYGYLYLFNGELRTFRGKIPSSTNQIAELMAVKESLKNCLSSDVEIYTDSKYVIGCCTTWWKNWIRNGWKNSKGENVANRELIEEILNLCKTKNVKFIHVYAHRGDKYNEMADRLANEGRLL